MASIRNFMFSYESLLCTEWPTGIEGRVLPLWRRTALRLNLDKSIKSRQSRGLWLILSVCIRPSISVQGSRPLSILKKWTGSSCLLQYTEIITHHLGAQCWHMYPFPSNYFMHSDTLHVSWQLEPRIEFSGHIWFQHVELKRNQLFWLRIHYVCWPVYSDMSDRSQGISKHAGSDFEEDSELWHMSLISFMFTCECWHIL